MEAKDSSSEDCSPLSQTRSTEEMNNPSISVDVIGMNFEDYFHRRQLNDPQPEEPVPPFDNPLETTQNREDWIRSQEDFKIRHELAEILNRSISMLGEPLKASDEFSAEIQNELAKFSAYFELPSWEAITLGNNQSVSFANSQLGKEAMSFTRNEEQGHRFLEMEESKQFGGNS